MDFEQWAKEYNLDNEFDCRAAWEAATKAACGACEKASYYEQLAKTLAANAENDKLSDADFRRVVRNSIPEF